MPKNDAAGRFRSLLTKLARVPKLELDEKKREYQERRETAKATRSAKRRQHNSSS